MIKMAVFDMAGTTVNENNVVYKTVQKAVNDAGIDASLDEVLDVGAGKEKLQAIKSVLELKNINNDKLAEEIFSRFKIMLDEAYATSEISGQPHALELFHALKQRDVLVVLNTGYSRQVAEGLIEKLGWKKDTDFDLLVTASDVERNRPNPDMILYAMKAFDITDAATVIKTGDSAIDIEEGRNAGCRYNIGITTGAQTYEQLKSGNPSFIINDLMELLPIVEQE